MLASVFAEELNSHAHSTSPQWPVVSSFFIPVVVIAQRNPISQVGTKSFAAPPKACLMLRLGGELRDLGHQGTVQKHNLIKK